VALLNRLSRSALDDRKDAHHTAEPEGIDAFASEDTLVAGDRFDAGPTATGEDAGEATATRSAGAVTWAVAILLVAGAGGAGYWAWSQRAPATPAPASLTVQTTPPGLQVTIAGKPAGVTPVTMSLPPGEYRVGLSAADGRQRDFAVTLAAGASLVRDVEMAPLAAAVPSGSLHVETEPARQAVLVDGIDRGFSPITVAELTPGEHQVVVRTAGGNIRRTIQVREGETVSLLVSGAELPAVRAGWVTFSSPIRLELRENGRFLGSTDVERLMLPAGEHEIEMTNDALGFQTTRRIAIAADRTTAVPVEVPTGTVNINALPWAEVWLGGERIGETPIANLSRPIGNYEVLLRHPQYGERRARVTVSARQTARLGVDMRAK
jgi:hypothetical protein